MGYKPFSPDQMGLITAIQGELNRQNPSSSFDARLYNTIIEAANLISNECCRERITANKGMSPAEWLASDDVGQSSKYMLTVLAKVGIPAPDGPTPLDADDLGRCIRMVNACGFESRVKMMSQMGNSWKSIANNWTQLVSWYDKSQWDTIYKFLSELEN